MRTQIKLERNSTPLEITEKTSVSDIQNTLAHAKKSHDNKHSMVIYCADNKLMSTWLQDEKKDGLGEAKNTIEKIFVADSAQKLIRGKISEALTLKNYDQNQKNQLSEALQKISGPPVQSHLPLSTLEEAMKPVDTLNRAMFIQSLTSVCVSLKPNTDSKDTNSENDFPDKLLDFFDAAENLITKNPDKEFEICLGPTNDKGHAFYLKEKGLSEEENKTISNSQNRIETEGNRDAGLATSFFKTLLEDGISQPDKLHAITAGAALSQLNSTMPDNKIFIKLFHNYLSESNQSRSPFMKL